ncbi:hypothetical protein ACTOB_003671 [Actinoplanes oblitus]|uniref:DUF304 domain-containing protein n=1 Tax=Actinoplanes oblitus TaxID=3040509 RepID=A0ABY8WRB1_9ACTN|nr:hypothetical protein [Actinoplanes oblitus]WIM99997.1 hypothetical protein ACTOB_003671 [Actinoplanes oblitus]
MADGYSPTPGTFVYQWSLWRFAFAMAAMGGFGAITAWILFSVLSIAIDGTWSLPPASFAGVYTCAFAIFSVLFSRGRPPWLRFDDEGIELAAARHDGVRVAYATVARARVRWLWPITVLEIVVNAADESQVAWLSRGGRQPLLKRKDGQLRFSIPTAGMIPGAASIRAEIHSRGLVE